MASMYRFLKHTRNKKNRLQCFSEVTVMSALKRICSPETMFTDNYEGMFLFWLVVAGSVFDQDVE